MKHYHFSTTFITGLLAGMIILLQLSFLEADYKSGNKRVSNWEPPKLPEQMSLFGERVPLERPEIREDLDREFIYNFYNQAHMVYLLKLANRHFPVIEQRLKQNGLHDDFKYLCVAESSLQNLISKAGATGYWQFMKGTAPAYGLEVNDKIDERYHLLKSTDAASRYLKKAHAAFGNWTAAAASYNCGIGGFNMQANFQQTKNYYDLHLPEETMKYIYRILALKYILTNAENLGLKLREDDFYINLPSKSANVNASIGNLALWAKSQGTDYKTLRKLNPWIRGKTLPVKPGKSYEVVLPK